MNIVLSKNVTKRNNNNKREYKMLKFAPHIISLFILPVQGTALLSDRYGITVQLPFPTGLK